MHKFILTYCGILLLFLAFYYTSVSSNIIGDCRRFKTCSVTTSAGRCDIALTREKCDGSNGSSFSACVEQGCIENCICNCLRDGSGTVTGRTFSWYDSCTETVKGQTDECGGCPAPTPTPSPTPCPTPTSPPPNGRTDCLWIKSNCRWACGPIADITEEECNDSGGFWNFTSNTCTSEPVKQ
jgi:hypothetical protein